MLRKLTHSALKIYGEGMPKIAQMVVIESEELRDILKTYDEKQLILNWKWVRPIS